MNASRSNDVSNYQAQWYVVSLSVPLIISASPVNCMFRHFPTKSYCSSVNMRLLIILSFLITLSSCQQAKTRSQKILQSLDNAPVIHFTLSRRGGTFEATKPSSDHLELDILLEQLRLTEARFDLTQREVRGNKLVRKAKTHAVGGQDENGLMGKIASNGSW